MFHATRVDAPLHTESRLYPNIILSNEYNPRLYFNKNIIILLLITIILIKILLLYHTYYTS